MEFRHGDLSCPSDVYEHQGKYYLPVIPSQNISCANGGQGKLKGKTTWDAVRIIQQDDGPYLGKGLFLKFSSQLTHLTNSVFRANIIRIENLYRDNVSLEKPLLVPNECSLLLIS